MTGIETNVLAHAVPELPLTAVSDVRILEGELHEDALSVGAAPHHPARRPCRRRLPQ